jgi:hypothetical protein
MFDSEPIPCDLEEQKKCQTMVFISFHEHQESDNFQGQNDFLRQFISHEKAYLSHLLNPEMPPTNFACSSCGFVEAEFHCLECYGSHWWCQSCVMLNIPFIAPNSGKKDPLKMFHCATWAMFLYLVTQAQVVHVQRMTTCLKIAT